MTFQRQTRRYLHPQMNLRENITAKLLAIFGPETFTEDQRRMVEELVDDIAEYANGAT